MMIYAVYDIDDMPIGVFDRVELIDWIAKVHKSRRSAECTVSRITLGYFNKIKYKGSIYTVYVYKDKE